MPSRETVESQGKLVKEPARLVCFQGGSICRLLQESPLYFFGKLNEYVLCNQTLKTKTTRKVNRQRREFLAQKIKGKQMNKKKSRKVV